jgi:hypothetical protein
MRSEVRKLLLSAEDSMRSEVRISPMVNRAYMVGIEEDLTIGQIALLLIPHLLEENRRLMNNEVARISLADPQPFIVDRSSIKTAYANLNEDGSISLHGLKGQRPR